MLNGIFSDPIPSITGILQKRENLIGVLSEPHELTCTIDKSAVVNYYTGDYEITPAVYSQIMPTRNKTMYDDVTVQEIPYYETSNEQGGYTVIIG